MSEWKDVGQVLLGSWPSQVAAWGREGIAAFLAELQGRRLSADQAIVALRSWEDKWPPSASEVARMVRTDPSLPTFDEAMMLIVAVAKQTQRPSGPFGSEGEMHGAYHQAVLTALDQHHPMVRSFAERQGMGRLLALPVNDPQWGEKVRRELREAWESHLEAMDRREVAQLASGAGCPADLQRLDPLASLGLKKPVAIEEQIP
jgi:hypothetical protein